MTSKSRKRSVTLNSLDPAFFRQDRHKERLQTSSINSLASGIAFLSNGSRPRSCTWHGNEDQSAPIISGASNNNNNNNNDDSIADVSDFNHECEFEINELLRQIITEELENELRGKNYDSPSCVKQAAKISQGVEVRVKSISKTNTKVVAVVFIGEIRDQGIEITSQCLWDPLTDSFATASFRNHSLFAVCTVFTVS
ncbi:uncharacterized protein LOC116298512 [Actinia tenebrosa]|uniref:Uncharacterized protein LOC116298512 n=1 Tax=Actinia tenebrosa TaxID=6105 RepID=A0A6P8I6B1_ACTTE|nr:uncharacterized protein LOC116298512 [Actinia tenebrosa]